MRTHDEAEIAQAMHLLNGDFLNKKIAEKTGRGEKLITNKVPLPKAVEELYLATWSRRPTSDEQKKADLDKGLDEADALLADEKLSSQDVAKRLPPIKEKYRLAELILVNDAKEATSETDHIEGANSPGVKRPPRKKGVAIEV